MADVEQILEMLRQNPEINVIEGILDKCRESGVEANLWSVHFAAKRIGRSLERGTPIASGGSELRELAQTFLGLHNGTSQAEETLRRLREMNDAGTKVNWQAEKTSTEYGWELSAGQELVDRCGGFDEALKRLRRCLK
jgi:hypothetical protein